MTTKIAVSLPDEQVEAARAAVAEGHAASVSAYVSEALSRRSAEEELLQLLDQDEERSPSTDEHRKWARRALGMDEPAATSTPTRPTGKAARSGSGAVSGRHVTKAKAAHPRTTAAGPGSTSSTGTRRG